MPPTPNAFLQPPVTDRDHSQGPVDATVTLVEYADFECPQCGRAAGMIQQVREQLGGRFRFVYRHFPLGKMHAHARKGAEAAEAAGAQGKFWEMHDDLFAHAHELQIEQIVNRASALGLDADRLRKELESGTYTARVQEDLTSGIRSGVNGTPAFFINGNRLIGAATVESLTTAIQSHLG